MQPEPNLPLPQVIRRLRQLMTAPQETKALNKWLHQAELLEFLNENIDDDQIILYASMAGAFIHAVCVPCEAVDPLDRRDLTNWDCNPYNSWTIRGDGSTVPPLAESQSKALAQGEQLVFCRGLSGVAELKDYVELSQQFVHVLGLHHMAERRAWSRIDRSGDIEDVVRVVRFSEEQTRTAGKAVLVKQSALAQYSVPQNLKLLRMFDFRLHHPNSDIGVCSQDLERKELCVSPSLYANLHIKTGFTSFSHGFQVASIPYCEEDDYFSIGKQYEEFIAYDFKADRVRKISCSPEALSNYHESSPLPYETSPAFFKADVLLKYKTDYEKYTFGERSISCRGSWSLQTYDINDAGQVHTYLIYLGYLPHEEQLYWKAFNVSPKAPIAKRAFEWDFRGNFNHHDDDPLIELKYFLRTLQCPWWAFPSSDKLERMMNRVHYPLSESPDEWKNEILELDQLLIEGLCAKWLKHKARDLSVRIDTRPGSIGLIKHCLMGMGRDESKAEDTVFPLRKLHEIRNIKAHVDQSAASELKANALSDFGSFTSHYTHLVKKCLVAFMELDRVFRESTEDS